MLHAGVNGHNLVAAVFAHQGGWDEILLVLGPIAVITGLVLLVRRRLADGTVLSPDDEVNPPRR